MDVVIPKLGPSLSDQVADALRSLVISGQLAPGQRLSEGELAREFQVSRGPIRQALAELERAGLVQINRRRGAHVVALTTNDVVEIYQLRQGLEGIAIEAFHARGAETDTSALHDYLDQLEAAYGRGDAVAGIEADVGFHRELVSLSGNARLLALWASQADLIRLIISTVGRQDPTLVLPIVDFHRPIVDALDAGDLEAAKHALREHLEASRSVMTASASLRQR